jgi:tripartite-type tricarboxylate transporter receptor subunit TctC
VEARTNAIGAGQILPWSRVDLDRPFLVLALDNKQKMRNLLPSYWERSGGVRPASIWVTGDKHYLAIRSDLREDDRQNLNPHMNAYFSYASLIVQQSLEAETPPWFTRGLAGVLSNTIVKDTLIEFGAPSEGHWRVRLVVPVATGTPIDILSRALATRLGTELGQPVVVELKPGATGAVGAVDVLRQPSDGYTLMVLNMPMSVAQTIYSNVPFSLRTDFSPVGQFGAFYTVLVVHPSVQASSAGELAAPLRQQPGKLSFSSGGPGTPAHVAGELFKLRTSTNALHVPYNQFPQAIADLLGGQNQFMFAATPPMIAHINAGKLRALAVTSPERIPALKDVPTMSEGGFPDFVVRDWLGLVAKSGVPPDIIAKVNAALRRALQAEDVRAAYAKLGADAVGGTPAAFGALIEAETVRWAAVAQAANLKVQ